MERGEEISKRRITIKSAKARGRRFQNWVRDVILKFFELEEDDVKTAVMGEGGEDIKLSRYARRVFPFSCECKNTERLNVWDAYKQAEDNSKGYEPLLWIKRNGQKPLIVIDAIFFIKVFSDYQKLLSDCPSDAIPYVLSSSECESLQSPL